MASNVLPNPGTDISNSSKCRSVLVFKVQVLQAHVFDTTTGKGQPVNRHAPADATHTIHFLYNNNTFVRREEYDETAGNLVKLFN